MILASQGISIVKYLRNLEMRKSAIPREKHRCFEVENLLTHNFKCSSKTELDSVFWDQNLNIFFGRETRFENIGLVLQEILTVICSLSNQEPILNKIFGIQIDHKNDLIDFKNTLYIRVRELIKRGTCWRKSKIKLKKSLFYILCAKYQRKIESFWFEKLLYIITRFQIRILNIRTR